MRNTIKGMASGSPRHKALVSSMGRASGVFEEVLRALQMSWQRWGARRGIGLHNERSDTPEMQRMLAEASSICKKRASRHRKWSACWFLATVTIVTGICAGSISAIALTIAGSFLTVFLWHYWRAETSREQADKLQYYADFPQASPDAETRYALIADALASSPPLPNIQGDKGISSNE